MDHSEGIQIPTGVLPQVSSLQPGLALIFKSPQMEARQYEAHISYLNGKLSALYPSFTDAQATGDWQSLHERFTRLRKEAIENKRVIFVALDPFVPREQMLLSAADHAFAYSKCMSTVLFHTLKANCKVNVIFGHVPTEVIRLNRILPKKERTQIKVELPEGVDQDEAEARIKKVLAELHTPKPVWHQIWAHRTTDGRGELVQGEYATTMPWPSVKDLIQEIRHRCLNWRDTSVAKVSFTTNTHLMLEVERLPFELMDDFLKRFETALQVYISTYDVKTKPERQF